MVDSIFLPLNVEAANESIRDLKPERMNIDLVAIPAEGGCVVAVIRHEKAVPLPQALAQRVLHLKQDWKLRRLLSTIAPASATRHG